MPKWYRLTYRIVVGSGPTLAVEVASEDIPADDDEQAIADAGKKKYASDLVSIEEVRLVKRYPPPKSAQ